MNELQELLKLLKIEQEEDFKNYQQYIAQTPLNERRKQGFCWYPVKLNYAEIGTGEVVYISVERTSFVGESHAFSVGSMVSFFLQHRGKKCRNAKHKWGSGCYLAKRNENCSTHRRTPRLGRRRQIRH